MLWWSVSNLHALESEQELDSTWNVSDKLKSIRFLDKISIQLVLGQHCIAALKKMIIKYTKEGMNNDKWLLRLKDKDLLNADKVIEHKELRKQQVIIKGHIDEMGQWGVIIYDIGEWKQ